MKSKRFRNYVANRTSTKAMNKDDVRVSKDAKTDEDHPGFPNGQSSPQMINPKTAEEKKVAAVDTKDGDKMTSEENANAQAKVAETNESLSDGSGGAFEATEEISDQH
ncbi:MAG: hypothetical protein V4722_05555 [Bacteroidota bacterium]